MCVCVHEHTWLQTHTIKKKREENANIWSIDSCFNLWASSRAAEEHFLCRMRFSFPLHTIVFPPGCVSPRLPVRPGPASHIDSAPPLAVHTVGNFNIHHKKHKMKVLSFRKKSAFMSEILYIMYTISQLLYETLLLFCSAHAGIFRLIQCQTQCRESSRTAILSVSNDIILLQTHTDLCQLFVCGNSVKCSKPTSKRNNRQHVNIMWDSSFYPLDPLTSLSLHHWTLTDNSTSVWARAKQTTLQDPLNVLLFVISNGRILK